MRIKEEEGEEAPVAPKLPSYSLSAVQERASVCRPQWKGTRTDRPGEVVLQRTAPVAGGHGHQPYRVTVTASHRGRGWWRPILVAVTDRHSTSSHTARGGRAASAPCRSLSAVDYQALTRRASAKQGVGRLFL